MELVRKSRKQHGVDVYDQFKFTVNVSFDAIKLRCIKRYLITALIIGHCVPIFQNKGAAITQSFTDRP